MTVAASLPMTEAELLEAVRQAAKLGGWLMYHTHDSRRSAAGFPDLVLAHPKRGVIFAELKSSTGMPTPAQKQWLETLAFASASRGNAFTETNQVHLWRPADLDAIIEKLVG